jgi:hypothetical protein
MAYIHISATRGQTIDDFHTVAAKLNAPQDTDGLLALAAGSDENGLHVVSVWQSKAHLDRWGLPSNCSPPSKRSTWRTQCPAASSPRTTQPSCTSAEHRTPGRVWSTCQPGACLALWCRRQPGPRLHSQVRPPCSNGTVWSWSQLTACCRQVG